VELRPPLHTSLIPNTSRGMSTAACGFEEMKRLIRDKRICFTASMGVGKRRDERDLDSALSRVVGTLNCRNRADNSHRDAVAVFHGWNCPRSPLLPVLLAGNPRSDICLLSLNMEFPLKPPREKEISPGGERQRALNGVLTYTADFRLWMQVLAFM